jgi:hypothetical protein
MYGGQLAARITIAHRRGFASVAQDTAITPRVPAAGAIPQRDPPRAAGRPRRSQRLRDSSPLCRSPPGLKRPPCPRPSRISPLLDVDDIQGNVLAGVQTRTTRFCCWALADP